LASNKDGWIFFGSYSVGFDTASFVEFPSLQGNVCESFIGYTPAIADMRLQGDGYFPYMLISHVGGDKQIKLVTAVQPY
jgi:hypothetical protein